MDTAVSLKTGIFIEAIKANYRTSRDQLLVCPECGEPVHFRVRDYPYHTPYFAHYKENYSKPCSLRTAGAHFEYPSRILSGLRRGQLVDRFQREFSSEIYLMLGDYSNQLLDALAAKLIPGCSPSQLDDIVQCIQNIDDANIFTEDIDCSEFSYVLDGLHDVSIFLKSGYGRWVLDFLFKTAYFLLSKINEDLLEADLGLVRYEDQDGSAIFVLDPSLLKQAQSIDLLSRSRLAYIAQVVRGVVFLIVSRWRVPEICPTLIMVNGLVVQAEDEPLIEESVKNGSDIEDSSPEMGVRFLRSPDLEFIQPPKDKWFVYRPSTEKMPVPIQEPEVLTLSEKNRIMHLIQHAKKIGWPTLGLDKERDLMRWAGSGYTLENTIFMAKYCYGIDYLGLGKSDSSKIKRWLDWAKKNM